MMEPLAYLANGKTLPFSQLSTEDMRNILAGTDGWGFYGPEDADFERRYIAILLRSRLYGV